MIAMATKRHSCQSCGWRIARLSWNLRSRPAFVPGRASADFALLAGFVVHGDGNVIQMTAVLSANACSAGKAERRLASRGS